MLKILPPRVKVVVPIIGSRAAAPDERGDIFPREWPVMRENLVTGEMAGAWVLHEHHESAFQ
jgi:hypothetical protein